MKRNKEFSRELKGLMIPLAIQNLMLAAVSAGDSAMLGFVDENAMAAVSLAGNIHFIQNLFMVAICGGGTVLTSQYWGKRDQKTVQKLFGLLLRYTLSVSVVFGVVSFLFPQFLMSLFTNERELIRMGAEYVRIASPSYLLIGISQCWFCVMKTTGQTKQSTFISTSALILDTALNAVFLFGFDMGVKGVALTTTITRLVEVLVVIFYTKRMAVKPDFAKVSRSINRDFLKCGVPMLINAMIWGIGSSLYSVILGHLGTVITAANAVATTVRHLAIAICHGLSSGGEILLANVLGSGDLVTGKEYGQRLSRLSVLFGFICAGLALIFGFGLSYFMTLSDAVTYNLNIMVLISAFYMISLSINRVVICCIFASGGDTVFDAYSVAVTMWLFILPAAAICGFVLKLDPLVVYLILSLDEAIKIPWVYAHYKKYKWLRNITREDV